MSYERVLDAINEHNLSWSEIDQIHLSPETYEDFTERGGEKITSNYATKDAPAVRETQKQEKIIYVAPNGMEVTVEI